MFDRIQKGLYWDRAWSLIDGNIQLMRKNLDLPLRTRKPTVWAVWNDFFHLRVPFTFQAEALSIMVNCPQHIFIILTKRHKQLAIFNEVCGWSAESYPNIWLGVSVEDQKTADLRIGELLRIQAAVRVVSYEPSLDALNIEESVYKSELRLPESDGWGIDWVIAGAETGSNRRECKLEWIRAVKDQCQLAGVPFFLKALYEDSKKLSMPVLDGRVWNEIPERR